MTNIYPILTNPLTRIEWDIISAALAELSVKLSAKIKLGEFCDNPIMAIGSQAMLAKIDEIKAKLP